MKLEKLVRMANQIATNFEYGDDKSKAVAGVVDHLSRFWTPIMLSEIIEAMQKGDIGLGETAAEALAEIAEKQNDAA
jgi:formate dehydrogenase subunit delta